MRRRRWKRRRCNVGRMLVLNTPPARYHTSATTAQDVIKSMRCCVNDRRRLFQNVSPKVLLYLMAIGQILHPRSNAPKFRAWQIVLATS